MKTAKITLQDCETATGAVVAIDVLRAFSTAAYTFAAGVDKIFLAGTVDEAFSMRRLIPDALLLGEVHGLPVKGFDLSNSPTAVAGLDLGGRTLIQRTSAGTQGIVRSRLSDLLMASSFCCASATARFLERHARETVAFVITGAHSNGYGDEDLACADYIEALLSGGAPDPRPYLDRVRNSLAAQKFLDPAQAAFALSDLEYCLQVDRFDFAMVVEREHGQFVMRAMR